MENPNKIEIEGLKTIHKLCNFGADHNMEGCSFTEIVERVFDELAKAQAVPEGFGDIQSWIAVNSFSALDAVHENVPIIDANELAKYIDNLIEAQEQSHD